MSAGDNEKLLGGRSGEVSMKDAQEGECLACWGGLEWRGGRRCFWLADWAENLPQLLALHRGLSRHTSERIELGRGYKASDAKWRHLLLSSAHLPTPLLASARSASLPPSPQTRWSSHGGLGRFWSGFGRFHSFSDFMVAWP